MRKDKVVVKQDVMFQLYWLGKKENKAIPIVVDEILREGLELRRDRESIAAGGGSADCPF